MLQRLRGSRKRLILDIGTSAFRLCELAQTKTGYQLVKYFQKEYNSDPLLGETERRDLRRHALVELLKEAKVRTRKTIFGVPGQSVFTRSRALPPVPEYKVTQIVRYEIQQQIPFSLDQIALDYQILDRTESGGYEVMMAAIKTDVVDKHIDILQYAKRTVDIADVSPFAAYNWLKYTGEFGEQGECVALIDMGATTTDIVIERENLFRFTRPLNLGGNDITRAIANAFALNFSDAEILKRQRGFAPTGDPSKDGRGGQVIGDVLQRLTAEIMRSFAYFRSLPGGGQVNRVVLCGGGACLRNIIPYLQRQLGLEVRIAQPTAGLAIAPQAQPINDHPEQSCVALGLALRSRQTVPLEINLIPPRVLEMARRKEQALYWLLSLAALVGIAATIIPASANKNKEVLRETEELREVIRQYDPGLKIQPGGVIPKSAYQEQLQTAKNEVNALKAQVDILDKVRESRTYWLDEIQLLNNLRPRTQGMWFSLVETDVVPPVPGSAPAAPASGPGAGPPGFPPGMAVPGGAEGEAGAAAGPGGGRSGRRGGGLGAARSGLAGMAQRPGGMAMPGRPGAGPQGPGDTYGQLQPIELPAPFPSIEPVASGAMGMPGRGMGMGGSSGGNSLRDKRRAARGGGRGAAGEPEQEAVPKATGLAIYGFADSDQAILKYVEDLKKAEPILTPAMGQYLKVQRVLFDPASVERYPMAMLAQAYTEPVFTGGMYVPPNEKSVYSFLIRVRFVRTYNPSGEAAPAETVTTPPAPAATAAPPGTPATAVSEVPASAASGTAEGA